MKFSAWEGFVGGRWEDSVDVRDFIIKNYSPYEGDEGFLESATERTKALSERLCRMLALESEMGGVLDIDTSTVSSPLNYQPGYLDRENEIIVGIQTNRPLKRGVNPFGGIKMARAACEAYGYKLSADVEKSFEYRTTHNDGVFRVYTDEMRALRRSGVITGLPDAYGRGRIIGDYRRVSLYGIQALIEQKQKEKAEIGMGEMNVESIRLSEELYQQIHFLELCHKMAQMYGFDISKPAKNAQEAFQWLYFAYLAAIKEQNGAAMSLGRVSTFLDIYIERDFRRGLLDERGAQELVDQLTIKLRMARHLRTPEYNELFAGDPMWITEALGGMAEDGRTLVSKNSFRFLRSLYTLGTAPEPNLTVLWSENLPSGYKNYAAKVSIETDSIQYENDDIMRPVYGDDYGISCCVSAMKIGKQMQYFGARCNLPKLLLLALNGGRNEEDGSYLAPSRPVIKGEYLDYGQVVERYEFYLDWLCKSYVNIMNVIHYMHDKYAYEKLQLALHDTHIKRLMAFGIAGLSVVADSLSAIKHAKVRAIRDASGLIVDFEIEGEYPAFGNDDERVDEIAEWLARTFIDSLRLTPAYRGAEHTLSLLTITSNVVYGKKTGSTPDGRKKGEPFAPGANPMHNRECCGALASLNSISKLPYECCRDGISYTFSVTPDTLGEKGHAQKENLATLLDAYFRNGAHHINVNVLDREKLVAAIDNPSLYPNLTIRVSGYAVNFHRLSKEQQNEVVKRTFHTKI